MVKFGVTRESQLGNPHDFLKRKKEISIPLIASLIKERAYSDAVYPYFNMIRFGKTFKRTKEGRFGAMDDRIAELIAGNFPSQATLEVHDLASSNGTTSCHFYDRLKARGIKCRFNSSDKFTHIYLVTLKGSRWTTVLDTDGEPMQYVGCGFVLGRDESKSDLVNRSLVAYLDRNLYPQARAALEASIATPDDFQAVVIENGRGTVERFPLVSPGCLEKMTSADDFFFRRRDLFETFASRVEVVRALNILNRDYFSEEQLVLAIRNVLAGLKEDGLFIVGRSHDEEDKEHNVSVFRKSSGRFHHVFDYMKGSEIAPTVLAAAAS